MSIHHNEEQPVVMHQRGMRGSGEQAAKRLQLIVWLLLWVSGYCLPHISVNLVTRLRAGATHQTTANDASFSILTRVWMDEEGTLRVDCQVKTDSSQERLPLPALVDLPTLETLALLSDQIVVSSTLRLEQRDALVQGLRQRPTPTQLVLIVPEDSYRESRVLEYPLHETDGVDFWILEASESPSLKAPSSTQCMVSKDLLPTVVQRVYSSLGGQQPFGSVDEMIQEDDQPNIDTNDSSENDQPDPNPAIDATPSIWTKLDFLQARLEDKILDPESVPVPFAQLADEILLRLDKLNKTDQHAVCNKLSSLFRDHIECLRDQYGRAFEDMLDRGLTQAKNEAHMLQMFQKDAAAAVPSLAKIFPNLDLNFSDMTQGLEEDLRVSIEMRQELDLDEEDDLPPKYQRLRKIGKAILSRAVALGVNYLQGWLAYQAVKRAAIERERELPKFPLF